MAKENTLVLYGVHAIQACLENNPHRALDLYLIKEMTSSRVEAVTQLAANEGIRTHTHSREDKALRSAVGDCLEAVHQGVFLKVKLPTPLSEKEFLTALEHWQDPLLLVLDGVTDPHNLGACWRSADAAGVKAIIVPKDKSAKITATACKIASGAIETVPLVAVTNLARTLAQLQKAGVWVTGTAGESSQNLYNVDLTGSRAIVMGAEGKGLRRLTREVCDQLIHIPMKGSVESLNVSVATGVCLFEVLRQRQKEASI